MLALWLGPWGVAMSVHGDGHQPFIDRVENGLCVVVDHSPEHGWQEDIVRGFSGSVSECPYPEGTSLLGPEYDAWLRLRIGLLRTWLSRSDGGGDIDLRGDPPGL
jgi:hypothetical protein